MSGKVHVARRHDSALKHVTGQALYIDDMPEPPGTLHAALVLSTVACGRLVRTDFSAASAMPGVVAVLGPHDIPGRNDIAAIGKNEPLFAVDRIEFAGQTLAMVVAESLDAARAAAAKVVVEIEAEEPVLDIATALARESYVQAPATILRGDPERAMAAAAATQVALLSLPPKAPPIRRTTAVTRLKSQPSSRAQTCWTSVGCWVEEWTVRSPSSPGSAKAIWPSR